MKRLVKLVAFLVTAYLVYRILSAYLRPVQVTLDERLGAVPPYRQPPPPSPPPSPAPAAEKPERVDINQAGVEDLTALPGVGPALARRIVARRQESGAFTSLDELTQVRGIGPALVERLRTLVTFT